MWGAFAKTQMAKNGGVLAYNIFENQALLNNDIVSFEQLGPVLS